MANLDHMMQLDEATDDSASAISSASEEEDDGIMSAEVEDDDDDDEEEDDDEDDGAEVEVSSSIASELVPEAPPRKQPPKMRIKLSLRLGRDKSPPPPPVKEEEEEEHVQATVVQSSDDEEEEGEVVSAEPMSPTVHVEEKSKNEKKRKIADTRDTSTITSSTTITSANTTDNKKTKDTPKASKKPKKTPSDNNSSHSKSESKKESSNPSSSQSRPIRFPSISSPGLFMQPPSGISLSTILQYNEKQTIKKEQSQVSNTVSSSNNNGFVTPSSVFDFTMASAGYTVSARTDQPHRGSSIKRNVGDMFDSDVNYTLHFPNLIPKKLLKSCKKQSKKVSGEKSDQTNDPNDSSIKQDTGMETKTQSDEHTLPSIFIKAIDKRLKKFSSHDIKQEDCDNKSNRIISKPIPTFRDMIPISLTMPLPENYIEKRINYFGLVEAREKAIIAAQKASDAAQDAREAYNDAKEEWEKKMTLYEEKKKRNQKEKKQKESDDEEAEFEGGNTNKDDDAPPKPTPPHIPDPVIVPPIPEPPSPPLLIYSPDNNSFEIKKEEENHNDDKNNSAKPLTDSICIHEEKKHLVQHLDPNCFHYIDGRYYGLSSNSVADPQFVGPNAPGIAGLNLSGGTGLATSYVGSSSSGASSAFNSSHHATSVSGSAGGGGSGGQSSAKKPSGSQSGASGTGKASGGSEKGSSSKKGNGPAASSTSLALKRLMEKGGELAEDMRNCIIRAAVYHSKTSGNSGTFLGCDGETYPDVSKAFSLHGNLRPCNRCKSNKQGAYHCRLRRKHKEPDYDGGESANVLSPFLEIPVESLISDIPRHRPK